MKGSRCLALCIAAAWVHACTLDNPLPDTDMHDDASVAPADAAPPIDQPDAARDAEPSDAAPRASRCTSVDSEIRTITPVPGFEDVPFVDVPWISQDELLVAYFHADASNWVRKRASRQEPFGEALAWGYEYASGGGGPPTHARSLSADGQRMYASEPIMSGPTHLGYQMRRAPITFDDAGAAHFYLGTFARNGYFAVEANDERVYFMDFAGVTTTGVVSVARDEFELADASIERLAGRDCAGIACARPRLNYETDEAYFSASSGAFVARKVDGRWQAPERLAVPRPTVVGVAGLSRDGCSLYLLEDDSTRRYLSLATRVPLPR